MPHSREQLEMFVYELAKIFCCDWQEFSAFRSEVVAASLVFLHGAKPCLLTLYFVKVVLYLMLFCIVR